MHSVELIKDDGLVLDKYPIIVFSANQDLDSLDSEIVKRVISCYVDANIDRKTGVKSSRVRYIQDSIKTAFYREYLSRMMEKVPELLDDMVSDSEQPDLLKVSSEVLYDLFQEYAHSIPPWVKILRWEDYVDLSDRNIYAAKRHSSD